MVSENFLLNVISIFLATMVIMIFIVVYMKNTRRWVLNEIKRKLPEMFEEMYKMEWDKKDEE